MDDAVSRFWDKYIEKTKSYKIKDSVVRWYVIRVEQHIAAHNGLRLSRHTREDVTAYLKEIGGNEQIVLALKILFIEIVKTDWVGKFPWSDWLQQSIPDSSGSDSEPSISNRPANPEQRFAKKPGAEHSYH